MATVSYTSQLDMVHIGKRFRGANEGNVSISVMEPHVPIHSRDTNEAGQALAFVSNRFDTSSSERTTKVQTAHVVSDIWHAHHLH